MCGNFQEKNQRIYFTQQILIFRQSEWFYPWPHNMEVGELVLDVETAFLRTPMPESEEQEVVYVRPPALLVQFKLVEPYIFWFLKSVVYGLRKGPRL